MVATRVGDVRSIAAGCPCARVESAPQNRRPAISADVPQPGALRHCLGSDWRGDVVLRLRAAVFPAPQTMARSANRFAPTRTGQADLDDQRDHKGAIAGATG